MTIWPNGTLRPDDPVACETPVVADRMVLITGAAGLLGTWLRRTAPPDVDLVALTHRTRLSGVREVVADLRDAGACLAAVRNARPTLVIHTAYGRDEKSIIDATRNVVDAAAEVGADLLSISSDAVFSGDGTLRHEDDTPDPVFDYGRWKADAEDIACRTSPPSTIVRLPLIVSLEPEDHVIGRIRAAAADGRPTAWFDDELRQPADARELARAIWDIAALDPEERAGPWHLPGPERLTRYEIARRVAATFALDASAVLPEPTPAGAGRPRDLWLTAARAAVHLGWNPSPVLC